MKACACGRYTDNEHARCKRCRATGKTCDDVYPWRQLPEGCVTFDPIVERWGVAHSAETLGCEMRTIQRFLHKRRTFTVRQARELAALFGVRVKDLWPELAHVEQQLGAVDWRERAACKGRDLNIFFPNVSGAQSKPFEARAVAICNGCSVRDECLREAVFIEEKLGFPIWGVFGGLGPKDRAALVRLREDCASKRARREMSA